MQVKHSFERRKREDRRTNFVKPRFPFYDSNGCLVTQDRRVSPDRRLSYIQVEWISEIDLRTPRSR